MKVYLDTGFFIDFFSGRSLVATRLRADSRRGRTVEEIQNDSKNTIETLKNHETISSVITVMEYENNTYQELRNCFRGLEDIKLDNLMKTKTEAEILRKKCEKYNILLIQLTNEILKDVLNNPEYDELETKDAIHIATARSEKVAVIISTDEHLTKFDKAFDGMRIVDTDKALTLL